MSASGSDNSTPAETTAATADREPATARTRRVHPNRRLFVAALCALCAVGVSMIFGMRPAWFTSNDVATGEAAGYPELKARVYAEAPDRVFQVLAEAAAGVPRWTVTRADPATREVAVEVRTALFWFTDDLTARVEPAGAGSRVVIRSHSRVGRGDLGENARHIAALQQRMDRALGRRE